MHPHYRKTVAAYREKANSFCQVRTLVLATGLSLAAFVVLGAPVPTGKPSYYPAWWFQRGVIGLSNPTNTSPTWPSSYPTSDDYAALNQGQLKNMATQGFAELQAQLTPTNAIWSTTQGMALISSVNWTTNSGDAYVSVNLGQLKSVATPFYDVLTLAGFPTSYPWTGSGADDYSVANIGQAKNAFSFDLSLSGPNNLMATAGPGGNVVLNWALPSPNMVTSFAVQKQNTDGTWSTLVVLNNTTTAYSVTGLTSGTTYNFQVVGTGATSFSVPISSSATVTPATLPTSGLAIWFKADASSVTTNATGGVSSWMDQLSTNAVTQTVSSNMPVFVTNAVNGLAALRFYGNATNNWLYNSRNLGLNSDITMVVAGSSTDPSSYQESAYLGLGSYAYYGSRGIGYVGSVQLMDFAHSAFTGGTIPYPNSFSVDLNSFNLSTYTVTYYRNGVQTGNAIAEGSVQPTSSGITIGDTGDHLGPWLGDISEVLVYDHQLSTIDTQQLWIYLSSKYNFNYYLPAPTISPNGGTSTSVSFSSVPVSTVIRYTLDGTLPTVNSSIYSGTLTLTQSCPVTGGIFLNNTLISPVTSAQFYIGDTGHIGISDAWQNLYFGHTGIDPSAQTPGGSGLTNLQAYLWGYNPTKFSTNRDGLSDAANHLLGYAGTNLYISSDGLSNAANIALGLDPFGPNTLPPPLPPNPGDHTPPHITLYSPP